jgi:hypothetical protein
MLTLLIACACTCPGVERKVETVTLHSITMYDVWLWEQSGDYEDGYTWADPEPELFGPAYYYYPEDEPLDFIDAEVDAIP